MQSWAQISRNPNYQTGSLLGYGLLKELLGEGKQEATSDCPGSVYCLEVIKYFDIVKTPTQPQRNLTYPKLGLTIK